MDVPAGVTQDFPTTVGMLGYDWWLRMVINISVQYNGGLLPDIILLTQGYYHGSLGDPVKYHVVALHS